MLGSISSVRRLRGAEPFKRNFLTDRLLGVRGRRWPLHPAGRSISSHFDLQNSLMADNGLLKSGQMDLIELAMSKVESDIYLVVGVA